MHLEQLTRAYSCILVSGVFLLNKKYNTLISCWEVQVYHFLPFEFRGYITTAWMFLNLLKISGSSCGDVPYLHAKQMFRTTVLLTTPFFACLFTSAFHSLLKCQNCMHTQFFSAISTSDKSISHKSLFFAGAPLVIHHPLHFHLSTHSHIPRMTYSESVPITMQANPSPGQ
jgi:hypothetical protein